MRELEWGNLNGGLEWERTQETNVKADLSIVPQNVGANTNNTALVIGEKAADIIAKDLGITL